MLERVCSRCGAANGTHQHRCQQCAAPLAQPLQRFSRTSLAPRRTLLPAHWRQAGRTVALGVVAVAVEAGLHWLHQRHRSPAGPQINTGQRVVAAQARITTRWQNGQLQEQTIERTVWFERDQ